MYAFTEDNSGWLACFLVIVLHLLLCKNEEDSTGQQNGNGGNGSERRGRRQLEAELHPKYEWAPRDEMVTFDMMNWTRVIYLVALLLSSRGMIA